MINCEYVVDTLDELKDLEMMLFGFEYPIKFNTSIFCAENEKTYFYKIINVDDKLLLSTDGEY